MTRIETCMQNELIPVLRDSKPMRRLCGLIASAALMWVPATPSSAQTTKPGLTQTKNSEAALPTSKNAGPNIVIVLLDDVGFSASSTFGGPVDMPALDSVAKNGLTYNRFHVNSICSATRVSLLSGRDAHRTGFGNVTELATRERGYNAFWDRDVVSLPELLRRNGYSTAAFGKWHNTPVEEVTPIGPFNRWPTGLGFDYFYGFIGSLANHWEPLLYKNTLPVEPTSAGAAEYHLTTDLVDEAIAWIQTHNALAPDKPYFLFFAPGAAHGPHHVPTEWIEKYRGHFSDGWDVLRSKTFARQKRLQVIPQSARLTPRPSEIPSWNSVPSAERHWLATQMEVFAAFLAHTDHEVGRLIGAARSGARGDNTLILYIAGDNGADLTGALSLSSDDGDLEKAPVRKRLEHSDLLGGPHVFNNYDRAWAWATNAPFQWGKLIASHLGGTRSPLVMSWPAMIPDQGATRSQFTTINDIAPTLYDLANISFPRVVDGISQQPLDGSSFAPTITDPAAKTANKIEIFEQHGNRAIYRDGWIASAMHWGPWMGEYKCTGFEQDRWELYNIETDFSEYEDLAAKYPDKLRELRKLFELEAQRRNIYPLGGGVSQCTRPNAQTLVPRRRTFTFYPSTPRLPICSRCGDMLPDFAQSHRVTAQVVLPKPDTEGVIISYGSRFGGFSMYVKDNRLVYESSVARVAEPNRNILMSDIALPAGKLTLSYAFTCANPSTNEGASTAMVCRGELFVNDRRVAESDQPRVATLVGSLSIGQTYGSSVTHEYVPPFPFTGNLESVTIEMQR